MTIPPKLADFSDASAALLAQLSQEPPSEEIVFPPGNLYSNEPPVEAELHLRQILLLIQMIEWLWQDRQDFYAFGNLTVYFSPNQKKSEDLRGPDFFVVLDTERKPRRSWVVWEEDGKYPNVIIELLSPSTAETDRTTKKQIYQDIFRTPDYFWFDPETLELKGCHLVDGQYLELEPNQQGWLWSQQLQLFLGIHDRKLRFFTPAGELVPTPEEMLRTTQSQLETERQQKEKLAAKLRELGVDPDSIFRSE